MFDSSCEGLPEHPIKNWKMARARGYKPLTPTLSNLELGLYQDTSGGASDTTRKSQSFLFSCAQLPQQPLRLIHRSLIAMRRPITPSPLASRLRVLPRLRVI